MKLLLITQTVDRTHPVLGFFGGWIDAFREEVGTENVQVITTSHAGTRVGRLLRFFREIIANRADTVFVHMTPLWLVLGWPIWKLRGVKTALWYTHGSDSRALRLAVRLADTTFTATQKAFPFAHPRVVPIGHGIAAAFASATRPPHLAEHFSFLAVGRIAPRKRVRETLALFAQIRHQEPHAILTWVGSPQKDQLVYAAQVANDIQRLGLQDAVKLAGDVTHADLPTVYATHDLLLHLSDTGSLDKVVPEALAAGCPVFSTNQATAEGVGEKWFWGGRLDESAAAEALRRLAAGVDPAERAHIASTFALTPLIQRIIQHLAA